MTELKPCPFCGGEAEYWIDDDYQDRHVITCGYCGCERRYEYSMDGVIEYWNNRHIPEGYALMPTEPTKQMLIAMVSNSGEDLEEMEEKYKAAIAVAQEEL